MLYSSSNVISYLEFNYHSGRYSIKNSNYRHKMIILELTPISEDKIALVDESNINIFNTKLQKFEKKISFKRLKNENMKNKP